MALTTAENISDYLKRSLTSAETDYLNNVLLDAVDDYIQRVTGVTFTVGGSEDRYYDGDGGKWLFIDRATTVTAVKLVTQGTTESTYETLTLGDDYLKYPLNGDYIDRLYKVAGRWPSGKKRSKVTGTFGIASNDSITHAATMLAAGYLDTTKNLKKESIEGYTREFSQSSEDNVEVKNILDQYSDIDL